MTTLDQAFIKAYKQQGAAVGEKPPGIAPPPTGTNVEVDRLQVPQASNSVESNIADPTAASDQSPDKIADNCLKTETSPPLVEDHSSKRKKTDAPASTSPRIKRTTNKKSAKKGDKKTPKTPKTKQSIPPSVVYRLDPASPTIPNAPLKNPFASPHSQENIYPDGNADVPPQNLNDPIGEDPAINRDAAKSSAFDSQKTLRFDNAATPAAEGENSSDNIGAVDLSIFLSATNDEVDEQPSQGTDISGTDFFPEPIMRVFQPMLQVNHFTWPKVCHRLETDAALELDRLTEALLEGRQQGIKVVGIGGCQRGEGATTLLLCAARRLVARSTNTVIVDGDLSQPQLAEQLGLLPQLGWEDVVAGRQPLEEVLVESAVDNLVILPVCRPVALADLSSESRQRMAESLRTLRNNYNLVLIDLGPLDNPESLNYITTGKLDRSMDALILVHNVGKTSAAVLPKVQQSLASANVTVTGIIENFVHS
jgi:Mrp family chromosome partitioning ATPase